MRKLISLALVLCLILTVSQMALAETVTGKVPGYGSIVRNYLAVDGDLYDMTGALVAHVDGKIDYSVEGNYLRVADRFNAKHGLMTLDGQLVIPVEYDHVEAKDQWAVAKTFIPGDETHYDALGITDGETTYYLVNEVFVYNVEAGKCVATMPRDDMNGWAAKDGFLNIRDGEGVVHAYSPSFEELDVDIISVYDFSYAMIQYTNDWDSETDLEALVDSEGNVLTEYKYEDITIWFGQDDYFEIENADGKVGLLNKEGVEIIPMEYDLIMEVDDITSLYEVNGVFAAAVEEPVTTVTMIDTVNGTVTTVETTGAEDGAFLGSCLILVLEDDTVRVIKADGTEVPMPEGLEWWEWYITTAGVFFTAEDDDHEYVIDENGNVVLTADRVYGITEDAHILTYSFDESATIIYSLQ